MKKRKTLAEMALSGAVSAYRSMDLTTDKSGTRIFEALKKAYVTGYRAGQRAANKRGKGK